MNTLQLWLLQNAIVALGLALLVALVCRVRRMGPGWQHLLWLLVLIKLVAPPLPAWPGPTLRLDRWLARGIDGDDAHRATTAPGATVEDASASSPTVMAPPRNAGRARSPRVHVVHVDPRQSRYEGPASVPREERFSKSEWRAEHAGNAWTKTTRSDTSQGNPRRWRQGGTWAWLVGCLLMTALQVVRVARLRAWLGRTRPGDVDLTRQVTELAARMGTLVPAVRVASEPCSPFVCGLARPVLVWPAALSRTLDDSARTAVLLHELAHLRRRDHWVGWLDLLASCVWYFNPLFWYVRYRLRDASEQACDAWVVRLLPGGRRSYAQALIEVLQFVSLASAPVLAVGMGHAARRGFERRLTMILLGKVTSRIPWFSLIGIGLVALLTVPAWTQAPPSPNATKKSASDEFQSAREDFKEAVNDFDPRSEGKQPAARDPAGFEGKRAADDVVVEGNQPFLDDLAGASSQAELDQLEARLEQVLAEVRQLRERTANGNANGTSKGDGPGIPANSELGLVGDPLFVGAGTDESSISTLTRGKYKLPKAKGEALATFLKDNVGAEIDVKVGEDSITVTCLPGIQGVVGQVIRLLLLDDPEADLPDVGTAYSTWGYPPLSRPSSVPRENNPFGAR